MPEPNNTSGVGTERFRLRMFRVIDLIWIVWIVWIVWISDQ